jgi:hypothetical protein
MQQPIKYYQSDVIPVVMSKKRPFEITAASPEKTLHPLELITIDRVTNKLHTFIREGAVRKIGNRYFSTGFHPSRLQIPSLKVLPDAK